MDTGVLPSQQLREAVASEWIVAGDWRIPRESIQPASIDLRLGECAWALRCSFLPDSISTVEEKIQDLAFERIDLRDGATLERDRPYLVPLIEELRLPEEIRAKPDYEWKPPNQFIDANPPPKDPYSSASVMLMALLAFVISFAMAMYLMSRF